VIQPGFVAFTSRPTVLWLSPDRVIDSQGRSHMISGRHCFVTRYFITHNEAYKTEATI